MSDRKPAHATDTGAPARNFTIATEDRVRAVTAGPPAYMRRRRAIEELEAAIVAELARLCEQARQARIDEETHAIARAPKRAIARLAKLIDDHNRWYPIEANLPMRPSTGELLDRTGRPWTPMPPRSLGELLVLARTP